MNATELIAEVNSICLEVSVTDTKKLEYLNMAQLEIANKILLPGLADGNATVSTVVGDYSAPLPSDFHRGLFLAQTVADGGLRVAKSIRGIASIVGSLSADAGSVWLVATHIDNLIYQKIPEEATDIEIFYHRNPVPMTNIDTSFPDGITKNGDADDALEQSLVYYACWKCFSLTEQGLEGANPDTKKYLSWFNGAINELKILSLQHGVSFPKQSSNRVW